MFALGALGDGELEAGLAARSLTGRQRRAAAARLAISERCSGVRLLLLARPPIEPAARSASRMAGVNVAGRLARFCLAILSEHPTILKAKIDLDTFHS